MNLVESYVDADPETPLPHLTTADLLREAAAECPDSVAVIEVVPEGDPSLVGADRTDRVLTYAQLLDQATRAAHWLSSRFERGDRVAVWAPNVPEWIVLQYGAALAGMVLVTANPAFRAQELRYVLDQSRSSGLVHAGSFRGTDMAAVVHEIRDDLPGLHTTLDLVDWPEVVLGSGGGDAVFPPVSPDDPAQIQYTSGTTGFPKGALLHHRGVVGSSGFMIRRSQMPRGGRFVTAMPLFHTGGCAMSVLGCAHQRAALVLCRRFEPALLLAAAEEHRADLVFGVPTMLIAMLNDETFAATDLSACSIVLSGGSSVPPELVRRVESQFGARFTTVFGQTELAPIVTQTSPDDDPVDKANTCGRPLPRVELKIGDPATGETLALGEQGEVCARGYQTMLGYFDRPDLTAETLDADGWLHTGDLGTLDERGFLRITGRLKDMIIRGGENVYPAELEQVLYEHATVRDVAVVGVPHEMWGEEIAAVIVPSGADVDVAEVRAHCRARLAPHKTPTRWYVGTELPLTASGKVQKFRLREEIAAGKLTPLEASTSPPHDTADPARG